VVSTTESTNFRRLGMIKDKKLRPKYMVYKIDGDGKAVSRNMKSTDPDDVNSPFVLLPRKDPAAFIALASYASACESGLAVEIREFLEKISLSNPMLGTQGARNFSAIMKRMIRSGE